MDENQKPEVKKDIIEDIVIELPDYEEGSYKGEEEDVWDD